MNMFVRKQAKKISYALMVALGALLVFFGFGGNYDVSGKVLSGDTSELLMQKVHADHGDGWGWDINCYWCGQAGGDGDCP